MLNQGLTLLPGVTHVPPAPVTLEGLGMELSSLKKAEASESFIARVVEARGQRARGRLVAPGYRVVPTNLVEWEDREEDSTTEEMELDLTPFAIESYRLEPL